MNKVSLLTPSISFILLSLQVRGDFRLYKDSNASLTYTSISANKPQSHIISIPDIARILGLRVGWNGQERLERWFGKGLRTVSGHSGGRESWRTRSPNCYIETDGFCHNNEGEVLEYVSWGLDPSDDTKTPFIRHWPHRRGWLGVIIPGMSMNQVSRLTANKLPPPIKKDNKWIWVAESYNRPNPHNQDIFTMWTAHLSFHNKILSDIEVKCEGGLEQ